MKIALIIFQCIVQVVGAITILNWISKLLIDKIHEYSLYKMMLVWPGIYLYWGTHSKSSKLISKKVRNIEWTRFWWRLCKMKYQNVTVAQELFGNNPQ